VQKVSLQKGHLFVFREARLGQGTSEAAARKVRYDFLNEIYSEYEAKAIITAHHQDDLIETAIINILRGSGRKGLTSLASHNNLVRPLLNYPKNELRAYASKHSLEWREDSTNTDTDYLRNYIRLKIVPCLDNSARSQLISIINKLSTINNQLDGIISELLIKQSVYGELDRQWLNLLPHKVAMEIIASWLRINEIRDFNSQTLERLVVASKVASPGRKYPVLNGQQLIVNHKRLALV
jgi:tRNA(Ile)-lysidine synthase TilS/MesJ